MLGRLSSSRNTALPELAPSRLSPGGCRGIIGPFPPPLWISAPLRAVKLLVCFISRFYFFCNTKCKQPGKPCLSWEKTARFSKGNCLPAPANLPEIVFMSVKSNQILQPRKSEQCLRRQQKSQECVSNAPTEHNQTVDSFISTIFLSLIGINLRIPFNVFRIT